MNTFDLPSVSAIIPLHNGGTWIAQALESIQAQNYPQIEIVVVDDGSIDDGPDRVSTFPQVRLIHQAAQGVAVARNAGIRASSGEMIGFLDQDDRWLPDKTRLQVELLQHCPEAHYVMGWETSELEEGLDKPSWIRPDFWKKPHLGVHLGTMLIRRSAFERFGIFDPQYRFVSDHDWMMFVRKQAGAQPVLEHTVLRKRIHTENESRHNEDLSRERIRALAHLVRREKGWGL